MRSLGEGAWGKLTIGLTVSWLALAGSCARPPEPTLRDELVRSLGTEDVGGFHLSTREDEQEAIASLTSPAVRDVITWDGSRSSLPLKYTLVEDREAGTRTTYRAELAGSGPETALLATDLSSGEVVQRIPFPTPEPEELAGGDGTFKDLEACIADFYCRDGATLQCEANRTCKDLGAHLICCLEGQPNCLALFLLIRPTSIRCHLHAALPDKDLWVVVE